MNIQALSEDTLGKISEALLAAMGEGLRKTIDTTTGLTGYLLEAPAKQLVPLLSPFRQYVPRKVMEGGTAVNWKAITAVTPGYPFVAESNPAPNIASTVSPKSANFKILGQGGKVTREAIAASQGFDPALSKETTNVLLAGMMQESRMMMFGVTTALGTPAAPTVALATTAGSLNPSSTTYFARIVALSFQAAASVTINTPAAVNGNGECTLAGVAGAALPGAGAASTGVTNISAEGNTGSQTGSNKAVKVSWTPLPGAYAYAVFVGTTTGAANLKLEAIVTTTAIVLTSLNGTGVAGNDASVPATDSSGDTKAYDGIFRQLDSTVSGYFKNLVAGLSQASAEITAIQDAFAQIYETTKLTRFRVIVSAKDARKISSLSVAAGGGPTIFVDPTNTVSRGNLLQGYHVGSIMNAVSGDVCPIDVEPWLPQGTILIFPTQIWYPDANVSSVFDWVGAYDWSRFDYAMTQAAGNARVFPFENTCYGALRVLYPGGCGVITGILPG